LSYKRLGQAPFPGGLNNRKGSGKAGLSKNTTQFSRGHRVLRSGGLNHVNHHVHHVHPERTTKEAKGLPRKRTTAGRSGSGSGGNVVKPLRQFLCSEGHGPYHSRADLHSITGVTPVVPAAVVVPATVAAVRYPDYTATVGNNQATIAVHTCRFSVLQLWKIDHFTRDCRQIKQGNSP
jgi:hypothetical protein